MRTTKYLSILSFSLIVASSQATVINFSGLGLASGAALPSDLASLANGPGNGYEIGDGWTPDILVNMTTVDGSGVIFREYLSYYQTSYGDLSDVAYAASNGYYARIKLTGTAGHLVNLKSFDLAGYPNQDRPVTRLRVLDASGSVLWNQDNTTVPGVGEHRTYLPNLVASELTIEYGNDWNVGIDNISFTQQPVPEPATVSALALGLAALGKRQRKMRKG